MMRVPVNKEKTMCPSCQSPIQRKDRFAMLDRCKVTKRIICPSCSIRGVSIDAYVQRKHARFVKEYHEEKRPA